MTDTPAIPDGMDSPEVEDHTCDLPPFSLDDWVVQRDPEETDEEYGARVDLFGTTSP